MFELAAQVLSGSSLAGTRSSLTLLLLGVAGRMGWLPQFEDSWFASDVALALLLAVTVIEEFVEQDEDMQSILAALNYGIRGTGGALTAWALTESGGGELSPWVATAIGAATAIGTHHLRMQLHDTLKGTGDTMLSPRTWLNWLELGGVVGVCAAIVFAPAIALAFVVFASLAGGADVLARRAIDRKLNYADCPHCHRPARLEAWRCPHCRNSIEIRRWLGQETIAPPPPATPRPAANV